MSIVALSLSLIVLIYWLYALASGPDAYACARDMFTSIPGVMVLIAISAAFFNHWCMEVAHMIWDLGYCLEIDTSKKLSVGAALTGGLLTALFWVIIALG